MNQIQNASVYRICAVSEERWDVIKDASAEPVASFSNKHTALAYAMNLARTRSGWQLPLGRRQEALGNICNLPRGARASRI
jgi:hypothetical protein